MDIYLDNLVIYSDTIKDYMRHLRTVIDILHKEKFYLSKHKIQLFQKELKILRHIVNNQGIRMDPHKVESIRQWKVLTNKDLLQGFLGSVSYLALNIPQLCITTSILSKIAGDTAFFR